MFENHNLGAVTDNSEDTKLCRKIIIMTASEDTD